MQTKPFYQSKTLWTQLLAVLSLLIPAVQEWVATNPVEFGAVFAAINTIVRFVTKGAIEPFKDSFNGKTSLLAVGMLGMALASGVGLTSCSSLSLGGSGANLTTTPDGCALVGKSETLPDGSVRSYSIGWCVDGRKIVQWTTTDLQGQPVNVRATYRKGGSYSLSYEANGVWLDYSSKAGLVIGTPPNTSDLDGVDLQELEAKAIVRAAELKFIAETAEVDGTSGK